MTTVRKNLTKMRSTFLVFVVMLAMIFSCAAYAWSWSGALKGAAITSIIGVPSIGFWVGGSNEEVTDEVANALVEEFIDFTDEVGDIQDELRKGVMEVTLKGLTYIGLGFLTEEFFYKVYEEIIHRGAYKSSEAIMPSQTFYNIFNANYSSFFDTPIEDINFRLLTKGVFMPNAVTDCNTIYIPENYGIHKVLLGEIPFDGVSGSWKHMLHELKHRQQCRDLGGRREYGVFVVENWILMGVVTESDLITGTIYYNALDLHDDMIFEEDAENYAQAILQGQASLASRPSSINLAGRTAKRAAMMVSINGLLIN